MSQKHVFDSSLRVLVVDDQPFMRNMLKAILKGLGIQEVITADSGLAAIDKLNEREFDLVICDWNMPEGSGLQVLESVRKVPKYLDLPFIMLTAEVYRENVLEAVNAGVTDYIAKPFTSDILAEKLAGALEKRKSKP